MNQAFYTASTGAIQYKNGVDVLANNVANVNTQGFQASGVSFGSLLYTNMREAAETESSLQIGHGSKLTQTDIMFSQGVLQQTGNVLDYALTGTGFFAVQTADGIKYTRNGSMQLTVSDGQFYLGSTLGGLVLDENEQPIPVDDAIPLEEQEFPIAVFTFENQSGLVRDGGSFYVPGETSGALTVVDDPEMKQGYLESSSVDLANEMANVIECQKAFQFCSKMVQMSDEVMQTINNLR